MAAGRNLVEFILSNRLASNGNEISSHYIRDKSFHVDRRSSHGGDMVVKKELEDAFINAYTQQILSGGKLCVFEQPGDRFKEFVIISTNSITYDTIKTILKAINSVLREFFPYIETEELKTSVAVSKNVQKGKHRLSIIYPNLIVDSQRALMIRAMIVYKMQEMESVFQEEVLGCEVTGYNNMTNPHWDDAILSECYLSGSSQGRGNLMLGGLYKIRCKGNSMFACTKQSMNQCIECTGEGFLTQGEALTFIDRFDSDGIALNQYKALSIELVTEMCIRTEKDKTTGWNEMKGCVQISLAVGNTGPTISTKFANEKSIGKKKVDSKLMIGLALKSIHRCHDNYRRVKIREMTDATKNEKQPRYFISVCGPGSSYCCNINSDHKDSRIYFEINTAGIQQCCWICDKYKKKPVELPDSAKTALKIPMQKSAGNSFIDRLENDYIPIIDAIRFGQPPKKKQKK